MDCLGCRPRVRGAGSQVLPLKLGVSDPVFALFQLLVAVALPALLSFLLERPAASEPKGKQKDD